MQNNSKPKVRRPLPTKPANKALQKRSVPKSELGSDLNQSVSISTFGHHNRLEVVIKPSKSFQETAPKDHVSLFLAKCQDCQILCDFSNPNKDSQSKTIKTQLLKHLASAFTIPQIVRTLSSDHLTTFYRMLSANLFRPLPQIPSITITELSNSLCESAWPHLSLVYDAFLSSFNCAQQTVALTGTFISELIGNGASPDERERIAVRGILHTMYTKYMNLRNLIRGKVASQFTHGICSSEILEFLVSVVAGYNSPLSSEHISYFYRFGLPLHSLGDYSQFAGPLGELVIRYVTKSGFLLELAVFYILKYCPRAHRQKQGLFLREFERLLSSFEIHVTVRMAIAVFRLIGETTLNENTEVADTAISILMNSNLRFVLKSHAVKLYPLIVDPIYRAARKHWDDCIRSNAFVALQSLSELDHVTFNTVKDKLKTLKTRNAARVSQINANWKRVFEAAKNVDPLMRCMAVREKQSQWLLY
jgi:hypothetical protein